MKAFVAIFAILSAAQALPSHPAPAYGGYQPAPAYGHPAPAYGHPAPAYGHPAPAYGGYGYEQPKHNCSVVDVTEAAQVCTPTIATECADVELAIKIIVAKEQCYPVVRTVCTESIEVIPQEVCTYTYAPQDEATIAKTVEVSFVKETKTQMVTVCQPGYGGGYGHGGYGHGGYGHQYCNEVAQETAYNVPVVTPVDVDVTVTYPKPVKTCVDKPINLPRVTCAELTEEKCISVPEVEDSSVSVAKCVAKLGEPACIDVELTLPKQVCVELVYGYAHEEKPHHAPAYPAAPAHHA